MNVYCSQCEDQFNPVEYREQPVGVKEPQFCSDECADEYADTEELAGLYREAIRSAAPVFPS